MNPQLSRVVRQMHVLADCQADSALLQAFLDQRDDQAFAELARRHGPMVYSTCKRLLSDPHAAEDAFQATFVALARKGATIRERASLAPWLYGVACRVSLRARRAMGRRQHHESQASTPAGSAAPDAAWEELRLLLDEELNRLPDRLRDPLVLCYLQGRTRDEAAAQIGCTFGALKRRLEDGRNLLRDRLARRGIGLAVTGLAAAVSESRVSAALVEETLRLVHGSSVPPAIAALIPTGLAPRTNLLIATALLLGSAVTGTICAAAFLPSAPREVARALPKAEPPKPAEPKRDWFNDRLPDGAVARLGTTGFVHGDHSVDHVRYSPDGRRMLSISFALICVWDGKSGQLLAEFTRPGNQGSWVGGTFLGDDAVCLVRDDGIARVHDVTTRREIRTFDLAGEKARARQVLQVSFTPDGDSLAVLETDDTVRVWDVGAGQRGRLLSNGGKMIRFFAFANGVKSLAALDEDNNCHVRSLTTGQELKKFSCAGRDIRYFAFSNDGNWVATVGQTRTDHKNGQENYTTFEMDSFFELWDVSKGTLAHKIEAHPKGIATIRFTADCRSIYTGGYGLDPYLRRWDLKTGKKTMESPQLSNAVTSLDFSPDGKSLVGCAAGILRTFDATTGKEIAPIDAHRGAVSRALLLPNGRALTAGGDGDVREWELMTGKPLGRIPAPPGYVYGLSRAPDGRVAILSFSHEHPEVQIQHSTGKLLQTLKGKGKAIGCIAFSPDGKLIAAADYGANVILWDSQTGREIRTMHAAGKRGVDRIAFAPDGKSLLGASIDDPFCIWDVATGKRTHSWDPFAIGAMHKTDADHAERAMGLAFSHDLKYVALGVQGESRLVVCEVETGKLVDSIKKLPGTPVSIAFSPDGKTIAWGTWEGPIHLHDRKTGAKVAELTGHRGRVLDLEFTADGKHLVSCSEDTSALVWEIPAR
jgi:RNA polymerase sigma factor (sigma-70 family)